MSPNSIQNMFIVHLLCADTAENTIDNVLSDEALHPSRAVTVK